jgi:hypothetical protein
MSTILDPKDLMAEARVALEQVKEMLRAPTPQTVSECSRPLAAVAESLRRLSAAAGDESTNGSLKTEQVATDLQMMALALHRDLAEVHGLLQQAGAFYLGWSRILELASSTYGADGELRPPPGNALSVEG